MPALFFTALITTVVYLATTALVQTAHAPLARLSTPFSVQVIELQWLPAKDEQEMSGEARAAARERALARATPPADARVALTTEHNPFVVINAVVAYLEQHRNHTVWILNWDARQPPPPAGTHNLVRLVLAGPDYVTRQAPLAWLSQSATSSFSEFGVATDMPPSAVQAWRAVIDSAAQDAGKSPADIGYVIHDSSHLPHALSERTQQLSAAMAQLPDFDFNRQSLHAPSSPSDSSADATMLSVALGIAYAGHSGRPVLIAGTREADQATAMLISPAAGTGT